MLYITTALRIFAVLKQYTFKMKEKNYKEGFRAGFQQLRQMDVKEATAELWKAIGINNRESFRYYLDGKIEPKASQAVAIELVFAKYGITENIWGK